MKQRLLTVRVARWSATHPWRAIAMWVAFVVLAILVGNMISTKKAEDSGQIGETARAQQMIKDGHFPANQSIERILVTPRSGALDQQAAATALEDATSRLHKLPEVGGVDGPVPSPDGKALMLIVNLTDDPRTSHERVQPLLNATAAVQHDHPELRIEEVGEASIAKAANDSVSRDFQRAELFSIPVTLAILLVAFGALIAAGVPVLLALSAVGSAIGLSALASHLVPAQDSLNSVIMLIGMAVGVDYSLFYLRREREERAMGRGHLDAVEIAAATSGHAVVVSGMAVIISMAGMFLAGDNIFASFAVGSILVVAVSVLGSLTVLPALLAKLGRWVDRPRIPLLWRVTAARRTTDGSTSQPRVWSAILRPALRYPVVTLMLSAGLLFALATPTLGLTLKFPSLQDYVRGTALGASYDRMTTAFPSTGSEHVVVVKAPASQAAEVKAGLEKLAARTATDPLFAHDGQAKVTPSPNGTVTMMTIGTPYASSSDEARRSLQRLRGDLVPDAVGHIRGAQAAVTGEIAGTTDYSEHVKDKLPIVMGFVLLLTFLVMVWTFRSVVVAATAIVLNMLSVGAAYGLLVLVFQHTWAEKLLDFRGNGGVVSWLPMFLFVVLFGLSMDYHVFVVSRIREARESGLSTREAVAQGITRSAGVVTSAAIIMVGVFAIFGTLSMPEMKQLGVGLASAILIDATIIRAVVLPSLMTLLGEANWWMPRRRRPLHATDTPPSELNARRPELTPAG